MPATKRKRSSGRRSYNRSYKRRSGVSVSGVVRALAKANASMGPFGPGTANYERYGPSKRQMLEIKGAMLTPAQKQNRILDNYHGDGDYWDSIVRGAEAGGVVGGMAGAVTGPEGIPIGAAIGAGVGGLLGAGTGLYDQYFGRGDYGRAVNQIVAGGRPPISVNQGSDRTGDIVIAQTEYLGNISGSQAFTLESYELNPGLHKMFPFLSQIANNYELYEWEGLMVCYKPLSGEGGSDNVLGKVIICTNYDPTGPDFKNSLEMQNYDYCSVGKPSQTIIHGIETAGRSKATNMMYVRNTSATTRDRVFTDIGKLFIATEGMPSGITGSIGELHVTYKIRLSRAKLYATLGNFGLEQSLPVYWENAKVPTVYKSTGDDIFEILNTSTQDNMFVRLKDKNMVSGTFKITISAAWSAGSGAVSTHHLYPSASSAQNLGALYLLRIAKSSENAADVSDVATELADTVWNNAGLTTGSHVVMYAKDSSDNRSGNIFYVTLDNPSDKLPIFQVQKRKVASALGNDATCTLVIRIHQVDSISKGGSVNYGV